MLANRRVSGVPMRFNGRFDALLFALGTIRRCTSRSKGRSWSRIAEESGTCRLAQSGDLLRSEDSTDRSGASEEE